MKAIIVVIALLLFAVSGFGAEHRVVLLDEEETTLVREAGQRGEAAESFLDAWIANQVRFWAAQHQEQDGRNLEKRYRRLKPEDKATVDTLLPPEVD